jgi:hypothetical protein
MQPQHGFSVARSALIGLGVVEVLRRKLGIEGDRFFDLLLCGWIATKNEIRTQTFGTLSSLVEADFTIATDLVLTLTARFVGVAKRVGLAAAGADFEDKPLDGVIPEVGLALGGQAAAAAFI